MENTALLHPVKPSSHLAGPALATGSMISSQFGIAVAVPLMLVHGSFGISAMRLVFAALFCLAWVRPDFRRFDRRQWIGGLALGVAMGFLGPLALSVLALRGWPRLILPLGAALGVLAVSYGSQGKLLDPAGILFSLGAACGWAGYIVLMRHVGRLFSAQDGLCLSLLTAAALALPAACLLEPPAGWIGNLPVVAGLAILSPLLPFALEMAALRRMEMGRFSIIMSLEPAFGALFGFLILGQALSLRQTGGVLLVMAASAGAVLLPVMAKDAPRSRTRTSENGRAFPTPPHQPAACTLPGE
jgi:inner membrane transporter RhtA